MVDRIVGEGSGGKREAWKMTEGIRDRVEQPHSGLGTCMARRRRQPGSRTVDRARRSMEEESLTKMVEKILYSRWHGIELRMEGT